MSYFGTAWATNDDTSVRKDDGEVAVGGYVDVGNLENATDSNTSLIGETENYVLAVGGYPPPFLGPVYAGVRRVTPMDIESPGPGCKAYFYADGYTPDPDALYPYGTAVSGQRYLDELVAWLTLPGDRLAAVGIGAAAPLLVGRPGYPTATSTPTGDSYYSGFDDVCAMALLDDGTFVLAAWAEGDGGAVPCIVVSEPLDPTSLPASYDATAVGFTFDGVNPHLAAAAALCVVHGSAIRKIQTHTPFAATEVWTSALVDSVSGGGARIIASPDMFKTAVKAPTPATDLYLGSFTYGESGGELSYAWDSWMLVIDGDYQVTEFNLGAYAAKSVYADSHQWAEPATPPFWTNMVRSAEII